MKSVEAANKNEIQVIHSTLEKKFPSIPKRNQDAGYFISSSLHAFSRYLLNVHGFPVKPSGMTVGVIPAPSSSLGIYMPMSGKLAANSVCE